MKSIFYPIGTQKTHPVLQKITLPIKKQEDCVEIFKKHFRIQQSQMCVGGEGGKDSCGGDSGGPLAMVRPIEDSDVFFVNIHLISKFLVKHHCVLVVHTQ